MAPSDKNEIYLASSPHFGAKADTTKIMLCVIFSLLPLCIMGVVLFGIPALITILVSTVSCVFFEWAFRKIIKAPCRLLDWSAAVTGILLALVLPPSTPIWITIIGAFASIVIAKEFFGGLGMNVFNPALTGRAFLVVSFGSVLTTWTAPSGVEAMTSATTAATSAASATMDAASAATPLALGSDSVSTMQLFLGTHAGTIGETSGLLILLAFVFLLLTRIIDWRAPVAMIVTCVAFETIFGATDPLFSLLTGGLLFGAVFMTTDYATTPVTPKGKLVFGFGCGLITALIRVFGGYPEGVMFSILIMNGLTAFLNRLIDKKYGFVAKPKGTK